MPGEGSSSRSVSILLGIIVFVLVVGGIRQAVPLVVPMLLALFGALIASPFVSWLRHRGVPVWLAVVAVVLLAVGVVTVFGFLAGSSLQDFSAKVPGYQQQLNDRLSGARAILGERGQNAIHDLVQTFDPAQVMGLAANLLNGLRGVLTNAFLIVFTMILFLFDMVIFPAKVRAAIPNSEPILAYVSSVEEHLQRYMAIKTAISLATGITVGIFLAIVGVDFPVLWGLMAFLLNYIPNIGSILAAIPPVLLAVIQFGPGMALVVAGGFAAVNVLIGNVIEPRITGQGIGLSTLVVFLSLVFWGWVLGTVGMLLAVPLTMAVKIALEGRPETHWVAVMLGGAPPEAPEAAAE